MVDYKVGDLVRVTWTREGTVKRTAASPERFIEFDDSQRVYIGEMPGGGSNFTVEVIKPGYEYGAMYVDAAGAFFAYWPDLDPLRPWFEPGFSSGHTEDDLVFPLSKLVPEGGE